MYQQVRRQAGRAICASVVIMDGQSAKTTERGGIRGFLNDNVIVGNHISGNGADTEDAVTPGPTGINAFGLASITGTVITGNVIEDEAVDLATKTPAQVNVHLNDLLGEKIGVDNLGTGTVDATENWWGSPGGPGVEEATSVSGPGVFFTPWLRHPIPMVSPQRMARKETKETADGTMPSDRLRSYAVNLLSVSG
jgi:hypothetical protein